jgi:AcrR family transcriptional regulator
VSSVLFLKISEKLFFKFGYRRVTIKNICEGASLSKMTFYRSFKNKEEVAKIVLKNIIDQSNKKFESIMESDNLFINKIENLILLNESLIDQIGNAFLNDIISSKANIFKSLIDKQSVYEEKKIEEYFKKAQKAGELNKKTPISFFIYMLKDIEEKLQDENLKKLYSDEKDLMKDLTNYYFFGIAPKNEKT